MTYFYPRSPCGERHGFIMRGQLPTPFLSTLSLRRATPAGAVILLILCQISIHALLAESDIVILRKRNPPSQFLSTLSLRRATQCKLKLSKCTPYFYPRSPCGERPTDMAKRLIEFRISIHALLAESDVNTVIGIFIGSISIHALLAESDANQTNLPGWN